MPLTTCSISDEDSRCIAAVIDVNVETDLALDLRRDTMHGSG
jgi:hypothetical protein